MPVYSFECTVCAEQKDVKLPVADYNTPQRCNECGELMIRLPPQKTSFSLKGGGWAKDLYGNKPK